MIVELDSPVLSPILACKDLLNSPGELGWDLSLWPSAVKCLAIQMLRCLRRQLSWNMMEYYLRADAFHFKKQPVSIPGLPVNQFLTLGTSKLNI